MDISLDWKSIAGVVSPFAPTIGSVLGGLIAGPAGAALGSRIGGIAGNALAEAFNTDQTPEAVGKAIADDPNASEKLQQLEADRGAEIAAQAQIEIEKLKQETAQFQIGADDTERARQFNLSLAQSGSPLSWGASILATVYTVAFLVVLVVAMTNDIKENQILLVLIGGLGTGQTMILSYFFGSSAGSKNSADRFAALAQQVVAKPNPSPAVVEAVKAAAGKQK